MSEMRRGGVDEATFLSGGATDPRVRAGTGDPEGAVVGNPGDVFMRSDGSSGTTFYVKETGVGTNTGWVTYGQAGTKRRFIIAPSQSPATQGTHIGSNVGVNGTGNLEFLVPDDFNVLVSANVVVIPGGTSVAANIDLTSNYGNPDNAEAFNANVETDLASTFPLTVNILANISIATVLTGVAPGDVVGVELDNNNVTGGYLILGLEFNYR